MEEKTGLKGWFNMECMLHSNKHLPKETKITLTDDDRRERYRYL